VAKATKKTNGNDDGYEKTDSGVFIPSHLCSASGSSTRHPLSHEERARIAVKENPFNKPRIPAAMKEHATPAFIAMMTNKWWGKDRTDFTIWFDTTNAAVKDRIVKFMNIWNEVSKLFVKWTDDKNAADFRCTFKAEGYYSYIGTDCKGIPKNQNTMNLQGMDSLSVPDAEMMRVTPHEYAHAFGCPHEHSRAEIIALLDQAKTIAEMKVETGWNQQEIIQQVFTVVKESALLNATPPDVKSIMCYWFSGKCTKTGQPIPGGLTLSDSDRAWAAAGWPKGGVIVPPPPTGTKDGGTLSVGGVSYDVVLTRKA
jgi:serralysin